MVIHQNWVFDFVGTMVMNLIITLITIEVYFDVLWVYMVKLAYQLGYES
jgi:hypothetical protein